MGGSLANVCVFLFFFVFCLGVLGLEQSAC